MKESPVPGATEPVSPPEAGQKKFPIPDDAAQAEATKLIKEVYGDEWAAAKTAAQKQSLAEKLLQKAKETDNNQAGRFVLFRLSRDIATQALDGDLAFEAIDAMASEYDISGSEMKARVLEQAAKTTRLTPQQKTAIAEAALQVIDEAIREDNFDVAQQLSRQAGQLSHSSKDAELVRTTAEKSKEVEAAAKACGKAREAIATLKEKPTDSDANAIVGKYQCFRKGDWEKGLPMLALSSDPALKALAEKDIKGVAASDEQVKLGDAWWNLAARQEGVAKTQMQGRAGYWYRKSLPGLSGLIKDKVEKRVKQCSPISTTGPKTGYGSRDVDVLCLLREQEGVLRGTWSRNPKSRVLTASPFAQIVLPVKPVGNYELQVVAEKTAGQESFYIVLPVSNTSCDLFIAWQGSVTGLTRINGQNIPNNPSTNTHTHIEHGKQIRVLVSVVVAKDDAQIRVQLDDRQVINWTGPASALSPLLPEFPSSSIGLGTDGADFVFHRVVLNTHNASLNTDDRPVAGRSAGGWTVIFRSADPSIWNTDAERGRNAFAMPLAKVPNGIKYLRLKRCDTGEYVIIEISKERLGAQSDNDNGRFGWNGTCKLEWNTRCLGVYDKADENNGTFATRTGPNVGGWGFGTKAYATDRVYYGWSGVLIPDTVFEIAVKSGQLSSAERKRLLRRDSGATEWRRQHH